MMHASSDPDDDLRSDRDLPEGIRYDPDLAVHEPMEVPSAAPDPSRRHAPLLIFPIGLIALSLLVYVLFGLIAHEGKTASDYVDDIRLGRADAWQAAYGISRLLAEGDPEEREPRLLPDIIGLLGRSADGDPRLRRYLILSLGRIADARAVDVLLGALADPDPESRLYAIWGLGAVGETRAAASLLPLLQEDDPGLRKMAAYALGALPAPGVTAALRGMLHDRSPDVAWNAALSLARLGDPAGLPLIDRLIDRQYLDAVRSPGPAGRSLPLTEDRKAEIMVSALRTFARLGGGERRAAIESIAASDPNLKVRQAALDTLQDLDNKAP